MPELLRGLYSLWGVLHQPRSALGIQGKDVSVLPSMASFFMLCDENTHLFLTVVGMPQAVTELRSMGDAAPRPEHCPLRQLCHGNSIISSGSDTVLATVHFPRCRYHSSQRTVWGASLFGLCLIPSSQPHAVVFCGARLFPRKRLSWIIEWRGTTAGSPHWTTKSQGFRRLQHQSKGTRPSLVAMTATRRMQCTGLVPVSRCTT